MLSSPVIVGAKAFVVIHACPVQFARAYDVAAAAASDHYVRYLFDRGQVVKQELEISSPVSIWNSGWRARNFLTEIGIREDGAVQDVRAKREQGRKMTGPQSATLRDGHAHGR
jgi:hypothetical protein